MTRLDEINKEIRNLTQSQDQPWIEFGKPTTPEQKQRALQMSLKGVPGLGSAEAIGANMVGQAAPTGAKVAPLISTKAAVLGSVIMGTIMSSFGGIVKDKADELMGKFGINPNDGRVGMIAAGYTDPIYDPQTGAVTYLDNEGTVLYDYLQKSVQKDQLEVIWGGYQAERASKDRELQAAGVLNPLATELTPLATAKRQIEEKQKAAAEASNAAGTEPYANVNATTGNINLEEYARYQQELGRQKTGKSMAQTSPQSKILDPKLMAALKKNPALVSSLGIVSPTAPKLTALPKGIDPNTGTKPGLGPINPNITGQGPLTYDVNQMIDDIKKGKIKLTKTRNG
jgi:hypothetical protein